MLTANGSSFTFTRDLEPEGLPAIRAGQNTGLIWAACGESGQASLNFHSSNAGVVEGGIDFFASPEPGPEPPASVPTYSPTPVPSEGTGCPVPSSTDAVCDLGSQMQIHYRIDGEELVGTMRVQQEQCWGAIAFYNPKSAPDGMAGLHSW
jgi:hypothetical protein